MVLSEEDRVNLVNLTKHPWYKVLEKIEKEFTDEYLWAYKHIDLDNEKAIWILKELQIYTKWREEFFRETEKYVQTIQELNISNYFKKPWQEIEED